MDNGNVVQLNNEWHQALVARGEGLLTSANLANDVACLEPMDAYYIVRDLGLGRALPILKNLSADQLRTCVDLDCWSRYDFSADQLDEWLTAFSLAGPESLAECFFSLDYIIQLLFLARTVIVYDPDTDEVPLQEEDGPIRAMTPDGFYLLELKTELKLTVHPFTVLDSLYQYDLQATHQLLSEVRVDLSIQIEEEALRFRTARMEELGFVTPDEAAELFAVPRKVVAVSSSISQQPPEQVAVYQAEPGLGLLRQAMAGLADNKEVSRVEQELLWTINTAIIAYGEQPTGSLQVVDVAKRVRDTISLGLESIVADQYPGDVVSSLESKAVDVLKEWSVAEIFRHGVASCKVLQKLLKTALVNPTFKEWFALSTAEQSEDSGDLQDRAFLHGLLLKHPLWAGFDFSNPDGVKGFASRADIHDAKQRLVDIVAHICPDLD